MLGKLAVGELDGESAVIILQRGVDTWTAYSAIRFEVVRERIERIVDYAQCPWLIWSATSIATSVSRVGSSVRLDLPIKL